MKDYNNYWDWKHNYKYKKTTYAGNMKMEVYLNQIQLELTSTFKSFM